MTKEKWQTENNFGYTHTCDFCGFYHDDGEELLYDDEYYCEEHKIGKHDETNRSFCRVMRDDGVKDYHLKNNEPSIEGCARWFTR
jgi:hypothetical protein